MSRPHKQRNVSIDPPFKVFKPVGVTVRFLDFVTISLDEVEALQLAHMEGFYQVAIAKRMNISRQTVARILESAHQKITEALIMGKAIRMEGGPVKHSPLEVELCPRCGDAYDCGHLPGKNRGFGRGRL